MLIILCHYKNVVKNIPLHYEYMSQYTLCIYKHMPETSSDTETYGTYIYTHMASVLQYSSHIHYMCGIYVDIRFPYTSILPLS